VCDGDVDDDCFWECTCGDGKCDTWDLGTLAGDGVTTIHACPQDCQDFCSEHPDNAVFCSAEPSCGNGVCEYYDLGTLAGHDLCPADCAGYCGDGTCDEYDWYAGGCDADCATTDYSACGDQICTAPFETTYSHCATDCD
jgi:hypothetical protein